MKIRPIFFPIILTAAVLVLSGCGAPAETAAAPTETPVSTPILIPTPAVTATPSPAPETEETVTLYGRDFSSLTEEIDLSGAGVMNTAELEMALKKFPHLKTVRLCDNLLSDMRMGELQSRHPEIRFIWTVHVKFNEFPSDAAWYTSYNLPQSPRCYSTDSLRYCRDLIAVDLGHVTIHDPSIFYDLPQLQYLILSGSDFSDLNFLRDMKQLTWFECFQSYTDDPSALAECTALRDLNVSYMFCAGDSLYETLRQMTWLKRLWCVGSSLTYAQLDALKEELPDTEIWCLAGDESTGFTWRFHEDYYAMRDVFHMYYMDEDGDQVERKTEEEIDAMYRAAGIERPAH